MNNLTQVWFDFKKNWRKRHLTDTQYAFLFEPAPLNEWVSLDCETTGLDRKNDHILTIAAVKIEGSCVKNSKKLELTLCPPSGVKPESIRYHRLREVDVQNGLSVPEAMQQFLSFIGSRPLVGYNIKFDLDMLNRLVEPMIGIKIPNIAHDVAPMFHQYQQIQVGHGNIDLTFINIIKSLGLPEWSAHDAYNDALMTALMFLSLKDKLTA